MKKYELFEEEVKTRQNNLIIGQSGGATAVINASLVGAVEAALADERINGIYGMRYGMEGFLRENLIDLRQQPSYFLPAFRRTPPPTPRPPPHPLKISLPAS